MMLSENFSLAEMIHSETAIKRGLDNTPEEWHIDNLKLLCTKVLQPIRDYFGKPLTIRSGFRSKEVNRFVGGAKNSQHLYGQAVDCHIDGVDNDDLFMWIARNLTFDQLIAEMLEQDNGRAGWIHVSYAKTNRLQQISYLGKGRGYVVGLEYV